MSKLKPKINLPFDNSHAFIIAINDYEQVARLQNAINDGEAIAATLSHPVHDYQIHTYFDATYEELKDLLTNQLSKLVQSNDRVLFYFAGHGIALDTKEDQPKGYLLPKDASRDDESNYISMALIQEAMDELECRHFLLVLDCCFSGAFKWAARGTRAIIKRLPKKIYQERFDRYIMDPAWQVLTSSAYNQEALDVIYSKSVGRRFSNSSEMSPFAQYFIQAISGDGDLVPAGQPDGLITATEVYAYIRDQLEAETIAIGQSHRQTPSFFPLRKHDKGEYLFLSPIYPLNLPNFDPGKNPYKGLQAFELEDQEFFFGRDEVIHQLSAIVKAQKLTIVAGASGSGKSSLIKAGILPLVKEWAYTIEKIRPGVHPLKNLESIVQQLEQRPGDKIFLLIDQFEELITQCATAEERNQFLVQIHQWLEATNGLKIIVTIRSDFEPQFQESVLAKYWKANRFVVPPFTQNELREIIERPAEQRVLHFEPPKLVDEIINEVVQAPGALPLLSFLLSELFEQYKEQGLNNNSRALTRAYYDELGGVIGSLRMKANSIYDQLDEAHQATMQKICIRMVSREGGELASRRVYADELIYESDEENKRVSSIIQALVNARLIVKGREESLGTFIEPAHDALVRAWGKLWEWIRHFGEETLLLQRRLHDSIQEYKENGQADNLLFHDDPRLEQLKLIAGQNNNWLNRDELAFVQESDALKSKKRKRLIRNVIAVVLGLLTLSIAAVFFGISSRNNAIEAGIQRDSARINLQLALDNELLANEQKDTAILERLRADSNAIRAIKQQEIAENNLQQFKESFSKFLLSEAQQSVQEEEFSLAFRLAQKAKNLHPKNPSLPGFWSNNLAYFADTVYVENPNKVVNKMEEDGSNRNFKSYKKNGWDILVHNDHDRNVYFSAKTPQGQVVKKKIEDKVWLSPNDISYFSFSDQFSNTEIFSFFPDLGLLGVMVSPDEYTPKSYQLLIWDINNNKVKTYHSILNNTKKFKWTIIAPSTLLFFDENSLLVHVDLKTDIKHYAMDLSQWEEEWELMVHDENKVHLESIKYGPKKNQGIEAIRLVEQKKAVQVEDGKFQIVNSGSFGLYIEDILNPQINKSIKAFTHHADFKLSQDAQRIAYINEKPQSGNDLCVYDVGQQEVIFSINPYRSKVFRKRNFLISPDGKYIAFEEFEKEQLQVWNIDQSKTLYACPKKQVKDYYFLARYPQLFIKKKGHFGESGFTDDYVDCFFFHCDLQELDSISKVHPKQFATARKYGVFRLHQFANGPRKIIVRDLAQRKNKDFKIKSILSLYDRNLMSNEELLVLLTPNNSLGILDIKAEKWLRNIKLQSKIASFQVIGNRLHVTDENDVVRIYTIQPEHKIIEFYERLYPSLTEEQSRIFGF